MKMKKLRWINHIIMVNNINVQNIKLSKKKRLVSYKQRPMSNYINKELEIRWEQ